MTARRRWMTGDRFMSAGPTWGGAMFEAQMRADSTGLRHKVRKQGHAWCVFETAAEVTS